MDLNLKSFTIGRYKILVQKCLTPAETKQWWAQKREEDAAAHARAIELNKTSIEGDRQHIREIEAGYWDSLIEAEAYRANGEETTRATRIADTQVSIARCERNLVWLAAHPPVASQQDSACVTPV